MKIAATLVSIAFLAVSAAAADEMHMDHGTMEEMDHGAMVAQSDSSKAFEAANAKMHAGMMMSSTGDADVDFVKGMIPHHQGAIDMAKVELQYGKDPEIRKLAEGIIKAQESEIAGMKDWLAKHGK